jgi:hypothetical protein
MTEKLMNLEEAWHEQVRPAHDAVARAQRAPALHAQGAWLAQRAMQVSICMVCVWAIVETPWEWDPADGLPRFIALMLAKCLLLGAGAAAFFGVRYARPFFVFLCAASVFALASALPIEYAISRELFTLSLIEWVFKTALVVSYVIWTIKSRWETPANRQTAIAIRS